MLGMRGLWRGLSDALIGTKPAAKSGCTPAAAVFFNCSKKQWLVEPVHVMGGLGVYDRASRQVLHEADGERLATAIRSAMSSSRVLDPDGKRPSSAGWAQLVREHQLVHVYVKDGECVVEPLVRHHLGPGGSYGGLQDREIRLPADASDSVLLASVLEGLRRARDEETGW